MKTSRERAIMKRRRTSFQPVSEQLEERRVLSTFNVTTTNDSMAKNPTNPNPSLAALDPNGQVSLRSALEAATDEGGPNTIILPNLPGNTRDDLHALQHVWRARHQREPDDPGCRGGDDDHQGAGDGVATASFEIDGGNVTISGVTVTGGVATMGGRDSQ